MEDKDKRFFKRLLIGFVALVIPFKILEHVTAPLTIAAAVHDGKVSAQVVAVGDRGSGVTITLTRLNGVTGNITIAIPSGTVLHGADSDGQRLIMAYPWTFWFSDSDQSLTKQIPTFCIEEFAATPLNNASLEFAAPEGGGSTSSGETEPLHRLVDCMAPTSQSDADKQLAVWAVTGDWLHKTRDEALQFVTDGLARRMAKERHDQLEGKRSDIKRMAPSLSSQRIDALIEAEYREGMPQLRSIAAAKAAEQIASFVAHDKDMLTSCGYPADSAIFQ